MYPCKHRRMYCCTALLRLGVLLALLACLLGGTTPQPASAATFVVTHAGDSGPGSLRQAILDASNTPENHTITFASILSGETIQLVSPLPELGNVIIDGTILPAPVTISGNNSYQVLLVPIGKTVELKGLVIANGSGTDGGGLRNNGTLSLRDITITNNHAAFLGGGIYNTGMLEIIDSTISGNSAQDFGGGISNRGTLTITNSTLAGNDIRLFGGGLYNGGTATITNSAISDNSAGSIAGGIYNTVDAELTIQASTITGNQSPWGGGVSNAGTLLVNTSTFSGNSTPGNGGGIENNGALTVINSTFTANSANYGGGISTGYPQTVEVANSTFSGNSANSAGGIYLATGTLNFSNTILANSISGDTTPVEDCLAYGTIGDNSRNLVESSSGCGAPYLTGNPNLGPLADNGGPTQTMALLPGSPALNAGVACELTDQRGVARPQGAFCDIGAYEQQVAAAITGAATAVSGTGAKLNGTVNGYGFNTTVTFEYGLTKSYGKTAAASPGVVAGASPVAVQYTLSGLEYSKTYHFRVVATNSIGVSYGQDQTFTTSPKPRYDVFLPLLVR